MAFPLENPPFIVIEGLDGAGTTTQTRRVAEALRERGQPAAASCEPSSGPIGGLIRQMLSKRITVYDEKRGHRPVGRQTLALLFAADRLDHLESEVYPALERGAVAISDRYYHSSLVYQGDSRDGNFDYQWVDEINSRAQAPDLTVYLEATAELSLSRIADRGQRDIFESREKLERLEKRYEEVMARVEERGERVIRLDATMRAEEITETIVAKLKEL